MPRPRKSHPTELELEILKILWQQGPLAVSAVRLALEQGPAQRRCAHTSVITTLNIMVDKGYLARSEEGKAYVYEARAGEMATKRGMLRDLVRRAFDGSAEALLVNLLETGDIDDDELRRIRQVISRKAKETSE